ncbi:hypothetical protein OG21DRAFT_290433 [Imleria badia]|nr:hypothetical protein OG21DRAFT_290433 [Imleria badia]
MAPHAFLHERKSAKVTHNFIGGLIAGVVVFVVLLCLLSLLRFQRSKANKKRRAAPVRGIMRPMMAETNPSLTSIPPFSRNRITASIIMPEKSITRKPYPYGSSNKAVVSSELTPFLPSSTLSPHAPPRPRAISILDPAHPRPSRSSSGFSSYTQYRLSPLARLSSRLSLTNFASPSQARPVHQPFEPTLSDELHVRCGEYLSVLRSFDDGWCVVARDTSRPSRVSPVSAGMKNNGDNVDIGVVPGWVLAKPLDGVASRRTFRCTSLNALRFGPNPVYTREGVISWAHFG